MAAVDQADGSEDVTDFLRRIKELGDKRDREDEARSRQLEQDIILGRKQREARRAGEPAVPHDNPIKRNPNSLDRARSLSPEKSSPATTPRSIRSPRMLARSEIASSPLNASSTPNFSATIGSVMEESGDHAESPTSRPALPPRPASPARMDSQIPETVESGTKSFQNPSTPTRSATVSWQQRPTSIRGPRAVEPKVSSAGSNISSSPAQESLENSTLSRDQIARSLGSKDPAWFRQTEDRGVGSAAFRRSVQDPEQRTQTVEKRELYGMSRGLPPVKMAEDQLATETPPPNLNISESAASALDVSSRLSKRPVSPTKGIGGFAQSAMLKRSESVTKRWSVQTPPALNRQISDTGSRGDVTNSGLSSSVSTPKLIDDTVEQSSRPTSSHSNSADPPASDVFVKPAMPHHKRSQSSLDTRLGTQSKAADQPAPSSPSKRWSPQKSSWLESALNRPESPTPKSPVPKYSQSQQPAWMVELNRAKQQRASKDFMDPTMNQPAEAPASKSDITTTPLAPPSTKMSISPPATKPKPASLMESPSLTSTNSLEEKDSASAAVQPAQMKSKPVTPPKKDFRSQLRSSKPSAEKSEQQEPEFLNAFGKLKRTQTEKYLAPDELKNNILRGKSALAVTEGPQKTQRRDELKESLVQQREAMKAKITDPIAPKQQYAAAEPVVPEAIAKKQALGRNDSSGNIMGSPRPVKGNDITSIEDGSSSPAIAVKSTPTLQPTVSSSNLANKFNSGLASIIARGPPSSTNSKTSPTASPVNTTDAIFSSNPRSVAANEDIAAGQLQHMTKGRARGPKRRLPNAGSGVPQSRPKAAIIEPPVKSAATSPPSSSRPLPPIKPRNITPSTEKPTPNPQVESNPKPQPPFKSPQLGLSDGSPKLGLQTSTSKATSDPIKSPVKDASALWGRSLNPAQSPGKSPVETIEKTAKEEAGMNRLKDISTGLIGPNTNFLTSKSSPVTPKKSLEVFNTSPASNTSLSRATPKYLTPQKVGSPRPPQIAAKPQTSLMTSSDKILADTFGDIALSPTKLDIDINAILLSNPRASDSQTKTVRKEICELGSDGKTIAVPSHQEHILFSNRMYLCTHIFDEPQATRVAEIYLWAGAVVGDAAIEDAQIFARKAAKDAGGKLVIIRQGKEPANFFQALGGIVITRSGWTRDSSNSYMLCGRQHLGHLAFDEVQFSASSLCSGFTYIISAGSDRVFLWKGSGCNTEELAGARLLSMDVGPSGKVTEVEEGREPGELVAIFASAADAASIPRSADHWKLKAKYENYHSRLFHIEYSERPISRQDSGPVALWKFVRRGSQPNLSASTGTQIAEVTPFAQSDLRSENIYVLDAFFEMYIIVGSAAHSKPQAFSSALLFAQEYAVLAASSENRPFVPVTTVVLEGFPRDLKRVFRKWDDSPLPTSKIMDGVGVKRGQSLKVMPLSQALGALRSAAESKP